MEVRISVTGFSPPSVHTDIDVVASDEHIAYELSSVRTMQRSVMLELLTDSIKQLCNIYQVDPKELKL